MNNMKFEGNLELAYERIKANLSNKSENFKNSLITNYMLFLEIRNEHANCSPSDVIDMLWHSHILDTRDYYQYCDAHFGNIVHHNPNDNLNQDERLIRLTRTINHIECLIKSNSHKLKSLNREIWNVNACCNCQNSYYSEDLNKYSTCYQCDAKSKQNMRECDGKPTYQIFVRLLDGRTVVIDVCKEMSFYNVVKHLNDHNYATMNTRFIFAGRQFDGNDTIGSKNICKESTLHAVVNLRGC